MGVQLTPLIGVENCPSPAGFIFQHPHILQLDAAEMSRQALALLEADEHAAG